MPPKKRKYLDEYVAFGFKATNDASGVEKPQCFICSKIFAHESMKPATLKAHLNLVHPAHEHDTMEMMKQKKPRFEASGKNLFMLLRRNQF